MQRTEGMRSSLVDRVPRTVLRYQHQFPLGQIEDSCGNSLHWQYTRHGNNIRLKGGLYSHPRHRRADAQMPPPTVIYTRKCSVSKTYNAQPCQPCGAARLGAVTDTPCPPAAAGRRVNCAPTRACLWARSALADSHPCACVRVYVRTYPFSLGKPSLLHQRAGQGAVRGRQLWQRCTRRTAAPFVGSFCSHHPFCSDNARCRRGKTWNCCCVARVYRQAVLKLANQQETMTTTLERMSW